MTSADEDKGASRAYRTLRLPKAPRPECHLVSEGAGVKSFRLTEPSPSPKDGLISRHEELWKSIGRSGFESEQERILK